MSIIQLCNALSSVCDEIRAIFVITILNPKSNVQFMNMSGVNKSKLLAQRLLLARRDLHWDQQDLAERSGVSRGYISNIERGRITNVGVEMIFALAEALGVTPAYLIGLTEDPLASVDDEAAAAEEKNPLDAVTKEFLSVFQQLPADKKRTLLDLARMLRSADEPRIIGDSS